MKWLLLLSAVLLSLSAAQAGDTPPVEHILTPSQLNASPITYQGKLVRVRGYVVIGSDKSDLWDSHESYVSGQLTRACVTLLHPRPVIFGKGRFNRRTVVLQGVFTRNDTVTPRVQRIGCNLTSVDVAGQPVPELVVAES